MGIDATLQVEGMEPDDWPPKDSRLFAKLYFDLTYDSDSTTNYLSEVYEFDLESFHLATDGSEGAEAWQSPLSLMETFSSLLSAMNNEGEDMISMPLEGYLLQKKDVDDLKSILNELIIVCKNAHESQKRVRIVLC